MLLLLLKVWISLRMRT